jgi:hypothetical protein
MMTSLTDMFQTCGTGPVLMGLIVPAASQMQRTGSPVSLPALTSCPHFLLLISTSSCWILGVSPSVRHLSCVPFDARLCESPVCHCPQVPAIQTVTGIFQCLWVQQIDLSHMVEGFQGFKSFHFLFCKRSDSGQQRVAWLTSLALFARF